MLKNNRFVYTFIFILAFVLITSAQTGHKEFNSNSKIEYFEINSPSLKALEKVKVGVYLPANYSSGKKLLPVIYYFSGFGQDETAWEKMGIKAILDDLIRQGNVSPMIVVFPGSEDTGWLNWLNGKYQWQTFITDDLIKAIDKKYKTSTKPCQRGISGNSMGGLGSLKIGFERPDLFGSVSAHSAALQPEDPADLPKWAKDWDGWEGRMGKPINLEYWKKQNPLYLAASLSKTQLTRQAIYFDVGEEDHLGFNQTNVLLSEILKKRGISHTFVLRPGGHGSKFVQDNAESSLKFHGQVFEKCEKKKPSYD